MPFEVKLPDVGEGVAEGEIVRWMVKAGDSVKEDQPLVEVMTDKASVEIPSPRTGIIAALHATEGQVVPVGTVIVTIDVADGAHAAASPAAPAAHRSDGGSAASTAAAASAGPAAAAVQATPAVRQLARQLGVALEGLRGTGAGGRITTEDVQGAASGRAQSSKPSSASDATGTPSPELTPAAKTAGARAGAGIVGAGADERIPLRGLRRKIAEHMKHSLATAAHFTFVAECDMTAVVAHRERLLARAREQGVSLTYLAYVVKAMVEPLREYPLLNASLDEEESEIVLRHAIHVGIATATDEGLTVPVVRDADRRTLLDLAAEIQRLASAARTGKLELRELQGGTITVTSTGARGGLLATPILHHPQVAIVGVHEVKKKPAVVADQIVARDMTNLSLSLDHRVVDGAVGADFLYAVIARLQQPESWLTTEAIG